VQKLLMTLRRKMTLQIAATLAGLLLVCAAALWGVSGLRGDYSTASAGYRELREMYEVASHVAAARTHLQASDADAAANELHRAQAKLDVALGHEGAGPSALRQSAEGVRLAAAYRDAIKSALAHLNDADADAALSSALGSAAAIGLEIRKTITDREQAANRHWRQTLFTAAGVCAAVVLLSILLGIAQYRSVVTPLGRLRGAANRMASGRLSERVELGSPTPAAEFAELADDFNRMARDLEALYRDLEAKVAAKSRELVRSERLASVGYLAAGVAHEINNPLSVITGYGERAIQKIEQAPFVVQAFSLPSGSKQAESLHHNEPPASQAAPAIALNGDAATLALKSLRVMCEEAYRCKAITDKLLSLARPGEEARGPVNLAALASEVVSLLEAHPARRDRGLTLRVDADPVVHASSAELKQVLLNLALNALEAVPPSTGQVNITVAGDGNGVANGVARISVGDNGRGMTPQTLERVFEPFFTEKRGMPQSAGTGLGLSISHAIVESHGGRLLAGSDGPGKGSQFTVELPAQRT
jgi:signal transduction histidine kinase